MFSLSQGHKSPKTGGGFFTSNSGQRKMRVRFKWEAGTTTPTTNGNDYADEGSVTYENENMKIKI